MKNFLLSGFIFLASINTATLGIILVNNAGQGGTLIYVFYYIFFLVGSIISIITFITTIYYWKLIQE